MARMRRHTASVLAVGLAAIVAAVALMATSWQTLQALPGDPAAGSHPPFDGTRAIAPTAFYTPPDPLPDVPPGTVLRSEQIKPAPAGVQAWRILYMSKDNQGQPIAISGYYAEPTAPPAQGNRFPLIALAHGTTGVGRACGMSQGPFTAKSPGNEYWLFLGQSLVDAGYAIVATDYEGMGAPGNTPYLLRKQAFDVLDSLRASINLRSGVIDTANLAVIGHSEGGYVALTTADQAAEYAPDLSIRGSVALAPGVIPPLPFAVDTLTGQTADEVASPRSGYITTLSQSWLRNYPDLTTPEQWYTPAGMTAVAEAAQLCQGEMVKVLSGTFGTYFQQQLPLNVVKIAAMNPPLQNTTAVPLLIQQGRQDTGVVPPATRGLAIEACNLGDVVTLQEFPNDVHRSVQFTGRANYLDWLADRFAAQPAPDQCGEL